MQIIYLTKALIFSPHKGLLIFISNNLRNYEKWARHTHTTCFCIPSAFPASTGTSLYYNHLLNLTSSHIKLEFELAEMMLFTFAILVSEIVVVKLMSVDTWRKRNKKYASPVILPSRKLNVLGGGTPLQSDRTTSGKHMHAPTLLRSFWEIRNACNKRFGLFPP